MADPHVPEIIKVSVMKAKDTIDIDVALLPDNVYKEALALGLKAMVNRGMTKITTTGLTGDQLEAAKAAAMTKAQENAANMASGKIRIMGAKADKASGAAMTEARRLARALVKEEMKRQGIKVSYVEASEITKAANALIAADPTILETAKANLAARAAAPITAIDVTAIPISAKKKAKADEEKAKAKQLSAAKAGQTAKTKSAPKQKPANKPAVNTAPAQA